MEKKWYYTCHLFSKPKAGFELSISDTSPRYIKIYCPGFFSIFLSTDQAKDLEEQLKLALRITNYDYSKGGE